MTKPDTKEIRDLIKLYSYALANGACLDCDFEKFENLCNAYDEAQKDIQCFKVLTWQQNQRISILERLLREVLEIDGISKEDKCQFCNLSYHSSIRHTMNCVFTRIQKELGEV